MSVGTILFAVVCGIQLLPAANRTPEGAQHRISSAETCSPGVRLEVVSYAPPDTDSGARDGAAADAPPLSDEQSNRLRALRQRAASDAARLAPNLASTVKAIYANMLADAPNRNTEVELRRRLHRITGALLDIKGRTMREATALLTVEQRRAVRNALRRNSAPMDLMELLDKLFPLADHKP